MAVEGFVFRAKVPNHAIIDCAPAVQVKDNLVVAENLAHWMCRSIPFASLRKISAILENNVAMFNVQEAARIAARREQPPRTGTLQSSG